MIKIIRVIALLIFLSNAFKAFAAHTPSFYSGFIENKGQVTDQYGNKRSDVKYIFQEREFRMILKENSWSYELTSPVREKNANQTGRLVITSRTDVRLLHANPDPVIIPEESHSYFLNFYSAHSGLTSIQHFRKITYKNIYPFIDLELKIPEEKVMGSPVKYSFIVHPGGNPDLIQLVYEGNASLVTDEDFVRIESSIGEIEDRSPVYFIDRQQRSVKGAFLRKNNIISFDRVSYEPSHVFIIDPSISYSTYYGGDTSDFSEDLHLDTDGNLIVTGRTSSTTNIATTGSYDNTYGGGSYDMFLLKFNEDFQLQWCTYFGGDRVDYGWGLALDASHHIYLAGEAYSDGLATTGAEQKTIEGTESDGFLAKFKDDGTLVWSRYFGGSLKDQILGIEIDKTGRIIATGYTLSDDSISTAGAFKESYAGNGDIFLAAFDTATGDVIWSTYYGEDKDDRGHDVVIDDFNNIYFTGTAISTTGIATAGTHHPFKAGLFDGFLAKFTSSGFPIWGTYMGGAYEDRGRDAVLDQSGNIVVTGFTQSDTGIATSGTYQQFHTAGVDSTGYNTLDAFVIKYDTSGQRIWGTYFGDTLSETSRGIAINLNNDIFITGATYSAYNIAHEDPYQTELGGVSDVYFAKFDSTGNLIYSSYFGGSDEEQVGGYGLIIRADTNYIYLCSSTKSADSIATDNAYQATIAGDFDVFIAKFKDDFATGEQPVDFISQGIYIFPNPAHDQFTIRLTSENSSMMELSIYSLEGKLLLKQEVSVQKGEAAYAFSSQDLAKGFYLLHLRGSEFYSTAPLVID